MLCPRQMAGRRAEEQERDGQQLPDFPVPLQHARFLERRAPGRLPPHRGDVCRQKPLRLHRRRGRLSAGRAGARGRRRLPLPVASEVLRVSLETTSRI